MPPQNRKFLAQKEKEDLQKRIIIISTIAILAIVFGLVVYGVMDRYVFAPKKALISLEGESFKADEFEQQVRWQRRNRIIEIDQILVTFQQLGGTPEVFTYFEEQLMLSVTQLQQPLLIGQEVIQALSQEIILRVEAEKLGIKVDNDWIDREIQEAFGFFADGTPAPEVTQTAPDTTGDDQTADETAATDDQGAPDPTATPLLKPTEYTEDLFNTNYQEFLTSLKDDGIKEQTIRNIVEMSIIRLEVLKAVTADVDQTQEQVWIQHILVADEETAQEVVAKLEDGEDFGELAAEYSLDQSNAENGGDLGWFARGRMVAPFEAAAFELAEGEISNPVETDFGFHILKSLGKDDLILDATAYEQLQNQVFAEWLAEKQIEYQPEINEKWTKYVPTEPALPPDYVAFIQSLTLEQPQLPDDIPQE